MILDLLKYSYLLWIPLLGGGILYNKSPMFKSLVFESIVLYLKVETKIYSVTKKINGLIKLYWGNDIFYYCDGVCIYKSSLKNYDHLDTPLDYDYIICKKINEDGEEMVRLFDTETELVNEYHKNNSIKFELCKVSIINAKITTISMDENGKTYKPHYNITPLKTSYYSGNKLFTKNYMKHFCNMELPEKYVIDILDGNIKSSILANKEQIELWDENYTILETQEKIIKQESDLDSDTLSDTDWEKTDTFIK